MTGAELIIRRPNSFAFMSVRHSGYDLVDWLKTMPKLTGKPEDIINSWLTFHNTGFGDTFFSKNRKPVVRTLKLKTRNPGVYFEKARELTRTSKLREFSAGIKSEITCSYSDHQVLIQNGQAYHRCQKKDTAGKWQEVWVTTLEYVVLHGD